jgi:hypothetical protein
MNLLRSICCLLAGPCPSEQPKPTKKETAETEPPVATPPSPPRPQPPEATSVKRNSPNAPIS